MALPLIKHKLRGLAATEFLLVAVPILLTGLGALEAARWFLVRQTLSQALLEAARAGATQHADPAAMQAHLRLGLLPLYASAATEAGLELGLHRLHQHEQKLSSQYGLAPWHLEILSPRPAHFLDFAEVDTASGRPRIPNSYQAERHRNYSAAGHPEGRGSNSGATLFEANTLSLRLTYPYTPLVPGMRSLLRILGVTGASHHYGNRVMREAGLLPIRQQLSVTMQSDTWWWPQTADAVLPATPDTPPVVPGGASVGACSGIWCQPTGWVQAAPHTPLSNFAPSTGAENTQAPLAPPPEPDPACGVVLCCT